MNLFFYGGTFDPPHIGHEMIIREMLNHCDKLIVFPSKKSPTKAYSPIANGMHRMNMLKLLFDNSKIEINDYEIKSKTENFTYLTILYLREKYKECSLSMIIGKDQLKELPKWKFFNDFINKINIICFHRLIDNELHLSEFNQYKNIKFINDFNFNISSTTIRQAIKSENNKEIVNMIDSKIVQYIKANKLYV